MNTPYHNLRKCKIIRLLIVILFVYFFFSYLRATVAKWLIGAKFNDTDFSSPFIQTLTNWATTLIRRMMSQRSNSLGVN